MPSGIIVGLFLLVAMTGTGRAEQGFDEKYQRDFNIFNPINQYQPGNRLDPDNPANPINQFNFNNRFNQVNGWVEWGPMAYGRWREHMDQQVLGWYWLMGLKMLKSRWYFSSKPDSATTVPIIVTNSNNPTIIPLCT